MAGTSGSTIPAFSRHVALYILGYSYGVVRKQCDDCIKNIPGEELLSGTAIK
jgi:hypothetical protein